MAAKIFGGMLIAAGIYIIGMSFSYKERKRIESLMHLKSDINLIMSELIYNRNTLYNALLVMQGRFKSVYLDIIRGLDNNNSAELSWSFGFTKHRDSLYMNKDDIREVKALGAVFSSPDCSYQRAELEAFIKRAEDKVQSLEKIHIKNNKLYRSLSLSLALFVVIVLF